MSGSSHFISKIVLAASVLGLAVPAYASDGNTQVEQVKVASEGAGGKSAKADKLICKRIDASESRLGAKRACHTKAQWDKIESESF